MMYYPVVRSSLLSLLLLSPPNFVRGWVTHHPPHSSSLSSGSLWRRKTGGGGSSIGRITTTTTRLDFFNERSEPKPLPWEVDSSDFFHDDSCSSGGSDYHNLKSRLGTRSEFQRPSLARLAVAFSPPENRIHLEDIHDIQLLTLDDTHLEITAVVDADNGGGMTRQEVTLLVPVIFPHDCHGLGGSDEEECILDNIHELEETVNARMIEIDCEITEERLQRLHPELCLYGDFDNHHRFEYPPWWIAPTGEDMTDECSMMKGLLNEEASSEEVLALAKVGLAQSTCTSIPSGKQFVLEKAVATHVGPAGLCLRARVLMMDLVVDDQQAPDASVVADASDSAVRKVVEVSWPFPTVARDGEELRASVLGALTSALVEDEDEG